jgi:hypothetical protein
VNSFSALSLTPAKNFRLFGYFLPVSTTPRKNLIFFGTAMKRRKGTSHILIRGPGGRQNYFKPKRHYFVLAASGASDQDVWGVYGCNFHGGSNDTIGDRGRLWRLEILPIYPLQLSPILGSSPPPWRPSSCHRQ